MGRKAKLKQARREGKKKSSSLSAKSKQNDNLNEFVQQIEKQGYQLQKIERSPEIPEHKIEPKL